MKTNQFYTSELSNAELENTNGGFKLYQYGLGVLSILINFPIGTFFLNALN